MYFINYKLITFRIYKQSGFFLLMLISIGQSSAQNSIKPSRAASAFEKQNYIKAIELFGDEIKDSPLNRDLYFDRGLSFYKIADLEKACIDWAFAATLGDSSSLTLFKDFCDRNNSSQKIGIEGCLFPPSNYSDDFDTSRNQSLPLFPGGLEAQRIFIDSMIQYDSIYIEDLRNSLILAVIDITEEGKVLKTKFYEPNKRIYEALTYNNKRQIRFKLGQSNMIKAVETISTSMPVWAPSLKDGVPVKCLLLLPIAEGRYFIQKANSYYDSGLEEFEKANYTEAYDLFTKTIVIFPDDAEATFNRGVCSLIMGDTTAACTDWSSAFFSGYEKADRSLQKFCNNLAIYNGDTLEVFETNKEGDVEIDDTIGHRTNKVHKTCEIMPSFPGGEGMLFQFLQKNIKYPHKAREAGISGRVYASFVVDKFGNIRNARIMRGIGGGCDEEAIRVIKAMPKWTPGSQDNRRVNVRYNLPINFTLKYGDEK